MKAYATFTTDNDTTHKLSLEIKNNKSALALDEKIENKLNKLECGLDTLEITYDNTTFYTCEELQQHIIAVEKMNKFTDLMEEQTTCTDIERLEEINEELENLFY